MKLSARQDIDAPQDKVFAAVTDFDAVARRLHERGVELIRTDDGRDGPAGARWISRIEYRGRSYTPTGLVVRLVPPETLVVGGEGDGLTFTLDVDVIALSRTKTRLVVAIDVRPKTFAARLLVQSAKLAKGRLTQRLEARLAIFAGALETRPGITPV